MTQCLLRAAPETLRHGAEAHPSVLARINPLGTGFAADQQALERGGIAHLVRVKPDVGTNHADRRKPLADVDMLPRAITLSTIQCAHRGGRRCIASQIVSLLAADFQDLSPDATAFRSRRRSCAWRPGLRRANFCRLTRRRKKLSTRQSVSGTAR